MGSTCRQTGRLFLKGAPFHPYPGRARAAGVADG